MSAPPPVRTPDGRALLEWVDERIERLSPDEEASTFDRVALRVWRDVRQHLTETLPYVEAASLVLVAGVSYPGALDMLGLYAPGEEVGEKQTAA